MKFLVTGATGFIGSHVIEELLRQNFDVIATSTDVNKASEFNWIDQVEYIPWNLGNQLDNPYKYFQKPDSLIHLAWSSLNDYLSIDHLEKDLFNNYYFIKGLIQSGLKDVNGIGTCLEYGNLEGCLSEDLSVEPLVPYAIAKDALRRFLQAMGKSIEYDLKWIRLFYMYGKGQRSSSLFSQLEKAIKSKDEVFKMSRGDQLRDYLPVEDVARYIVKISSQKLYNGIINCCSGRPISITELVESKIKEEQSKLKLERGIYPYIEYEPMAFWGDNSTLNRIICDDP